MGSFGESTLSNSAILRGLSFIVIFKLRKTDIFACSGLISNKVSENYSTDISQFAIASGEYPSSLFILILYSSSIY